MCALRLPKRAADTWVEQVFDMRGILRSLMLVMALTAPFLAGCGKEGPPEPPKDEPHTYPRTYPTR